MVFHVGTTKSEYRWITFYCSVSSTGSRDSTRESVLFHSAPTESLEQGYHRRPKGGITEAGSRVLLLENQVIKGSNFLNSRGLRCFLCEIFQCLVTFYTDIINNQYFKLLLIRTRICTEPHTLQFQCQRWKFLHLLPYIFPLFTRLTFYFQNRHRLSAVCLITFFPQSSHC